MQRSSQLERLWKKFPRNRKNHLIGLFVLIAVSSVFEAFSLGAIVPFLTAITNPDLIDGYLQGTILEKLFNKISINSTVLLALIFIFLGFLSGLVRLLVLWISNRLSFSIGHELSVSIYQNVLHQEYEEHLSQNSSEIIAAVTTKATNLIHHCIIPVLTIMNSLLVSIAMLVIIIYVNPIIAITSFIALGGTYILIASFARRRLRIHSALVAKKQVNVIKRLQEGLGDIREILLNNTQPVHREIFAESDKPLKRSQGSIQIISNFPRYFIETIFIILFGVLGLWISTNSSLNFVNLIPTLGALALGAQRMLPMLQHAYAAYSSYRGHKESIEDALSLLELDLRFNSRGYSLESEILNFSRTIELRNISFAYKSNKVEVLKNINFEIKKGSHIGIVGPTGCGKSTLLDILMALLIPTSGNMLIDGKNLDSDSIKLWRSKIAHVPQSIFFFDSSIIDNIAFVDFKNPNIERVKDSLNMAGLTSTVKAFKNGIYENIGESGSKLSGGQRQRLGIARALYKGAEILILDEATSALDQEMQNSIMESIKKHADNLTVIIVAHRTDSLKYCDKIIEINQGQVSREGNFLEILAN